MIPVVIVSLWMTRDPETVGPEMPIAEAALLMSRHKIRRLPVVQKTPDGPQLVGIVSNLDLARAYPPDVNPLAVEVRTVRVEGQVGDVMTQHPLSVPPGTPIEEVARLMRERKIGALPVTVDQRLVGIITESDIFRALAEILTPPGSSVRITFDVARDEEVLEFLVRLGRKHGLRITSLLSMEHDGRSLAVVRLVGGSTARFVDDVWRSGRRVVSVLGA